MTPFLCAQQPARKRSIVVGPSTAPVATSATTPTAQLPHKKRIAVAAPLHAAAAVAVGAQKRALSAVQPTVPVSSSSSSSRQTPQAQPSPFQCQLCSEPCASQLDFFRHLQTHYDAEPVAAVAEVSPPISPPPLTLALPSPGANSAAIKQEILILDDEQPEPHVPSEQRTRPKRERVGVDGRCGYSINPKYLSPIPLATETNAENRRTGAVEKSNPFLRTACGVQCGYSGASGDGNERNGRGNDKPQ